MKSGGGTGVLTRLKADAVLKVRFLQDPEDWHEAYYHFIDNKFSWCSNTKDCGGCKIGVKKSKLALANAVDLQAGKVIIVQLPPSLADPLAARADKMAERGRSLTDHDIDLSREGSGLTDTRYSFDPDDRRKMNLERYQLHDIGTVIQSELEFQAEMAEQSEEEPRSTKSKKSSDDEDDYEDDEDSEEEEQDDFSELDRTELKREIKKLDSDFVAKKSQTDDDLRAILWDLTYAEDSDDEDDEEEEEYKPKKSLKAAKPSTTRTLRRVR